MTNNPSRTLDFRTTPLLNTNKGSKTKQLACDTQQLCSKHSLCQPTGNRWIFFLQEIQQFSFVLVRREGRNQGSFCCMWPKVRSFHCFWPKAIKRTRFIPPPIPRTEWIELSSFLELIRNFNNSLRFDSRWWWWGEPLGYWVAFGETQSSFRDGENVHSRMSRLFQSVVSWRRSSSGGWSCRRTIRRCSARSASTGRTTWPAARRPSRSSRPSSPWSDAARAAAPRCSVRLGALHLRHLRQERLLHSDRWWPLYAVTTSETTSCLR